MKIALCCIGKSENNYIREFVEYYKQLGFSKIFLYDNNLKDGEHFESVIEDYISSNFVDLIDYRGKTLCQVESYNDCHAKNGKDYDWIAYFDCDEFLTFKENITISDFLSKEEFKNFNLIHINWMLYGDNGLNGDENIGYSVLDRFTTPVEPLDFERTYAFPENNHIKSIVRGNVGARFNNPHTPYNVMEACSANGEQCVGSSFFVNYNFDVAYIRHFSTKTAAEYKFKISERWFPDQGKNKEKEKRLLREFFTENKYTSKKARILGLEQNPADNLDIFVCAHKDFEKYPNNPVYKIIHGDEKINVPLEQISETETDLSKCRFSLGEGSKVYWLYKNYNVKKYIGINHYRRYFEFYEDIPDMDDVFSKYDVVATGFDCKTSLKEHYSLHHCGDDFDLILKIIYEKYPEYKKNIEAIVNNSIFCVCNMFIMKKDDFYKYCDFVFYVLKEFMRIRDFEDDDSIKQYILNHKDKYLKNHKDFPEESDYCYQSRLLGFLMERLTTIYFFLFLRRIKFEKLLITQNK